MGTLLDSLMNVFGLLGVAAAILSAWIVFEAVVYQRVLGPGLERDLGFKEGTAILPCEGLRGYISAVSIVDVAQGGKLAKAGVSVGDVLPDESHTSLFKKFHRHRGREVGLSVVEGGAGPPFSERPRRLIEVIVPPRGTRGWLG
jgi:hypothetical protein